MSLLLSPRNSAETNDAAVLLGPKVQECKLECIGSSCSGAITVVHATS